MYIFQKNFINGEPSHVIFFSSRHRFRTEYVIGVLNLKTKVLELKPTENDRKLKIQEEIKRDFPDYKVVEWNDPLKREGLFMIKT